MKKSRTQRKVRHIKKALLIGFLVEGDDSWMDLSDLSGRQIEAIYATLYEHINKSITNDFSEGVHPARIAFLRWFFTALAPRLTMKQASAVLARVMILLSCLCRRNHMIAALCHEGLADLIRRHPASVVHLIRPLREQFNLQYDSNMKVYAYDTPFSYFMRAMGSTQSVLLIAFAEAYQQNRACRAAIHDLLWEKGFRCIPQGELFKFVQAARQHDYLPLTELRACLRSVDCPFPRTLRLRGPLRHLLDEINYTLAQDHLPVFINELIKPKASCSVRLFSSKVSQVFHRHWRAGGQVYAYHELEHMIMLYISRHGEDKNFEHLFSGPRLGKILRHAPDFHDYMKFIADKEDISVDGVMATDDVPPLASSFESVEESAEDMSSRESRLRLSA